MSRLLGRLLRPLRASFAAKLLAGSLILALVLVGGVSAYLIFSRNAQTITGALSNSDNRVAVMRQVLQQFTGTQAFATARGLAEQQPLIGALEAADPSTAVPQLFNGSPPVDIADEVLLITNATGVPLYARAAPDLSNLSLTPFERSSAVTDALLGQRCALAAAPGSCGVDLVGGSDPSYAVAVPVVASGRTLGVVAYIAPLQEQLSRFNTLFQFPTAFVPASAPQVEIRLSNGAGIAGTTPPEIAAGIRSGADLVHATYDAPTGASTTTAAVAGSFSAVTGTNGRSIIGYVGVEVPLAPFVGDQHTDELTLGAITVFFLLLMALLIIVFVEVVVRRPIRRLERGVARIAGGDYTTAVTVRSRDELGRLATGVNRMRDSIKQYTSEIEQARARLDSAVERVSGVSRALTTTTGGVAALERAVVRAATAIAGDGSAAALALRDGDGLRVAAVYPDPHAIGDVERWDRFPAVLEGRMVRQTVEAGSLLAVPMFYQDSVVGALAIVVGADKRSPAEDEEDVLAVLANNAAIAMENARLYEQERETVHRLRQLDAMKTDFLATVQHELRTPLTAILGLSDLIDMCWDRWDDAPKLEAVRDIQLAARNLYDIVETLIDFNAVEGEAVAIHPVDVALAEAVAHAIAQVGERYKGGLPIPVDVDVPEGLSVYADPERLGQVLRAVLDNAVKFSDGNGRVRVAASMSPTRPGFVRLDLVDQGIGIPVEDVPRVFDRFFQVDNSATRRYGGTGMGLALVKRLVLTHGATVDVESELGSGTRIVIEWPATVEAFGANGAGPAGGGGHVRQQPAAPPVTVPSGPTR